MKMEMNEQREFAIGNRRGIAIKKELDSEELHQYTNGLGNEKVGEINQKKTVNPTVYLL